MIDKVRAYMASHDVSAFTKSLVEADISRLEIKMIDETTFRINCSILLQIDINDL
jgi:hypothetical protein